MRMKTTHNEIDISYNEEKDRWEFELRGRSRSAESLTKAKEAIDKELKEKRTQTFPRFAAYIKRSRNGFETVTVTSVADANYGGLHFWTDSQKNGRRKEPASILYPINDHNKAIVAEIVGVEKQIFALEKVKDGWTGKLQCATLPKDLA